MYDLFAPIVDNVQTTYTYDEAKKLVAKALELWAMSMSAHLRLAWRVAG